MMFSKQNLAKATFNISEKSLLDNYNYNVNVDNNNNNVNVDNNNNNNASKICQEVSKNCF